MTTFAERLKQHSKTIDCAHCGGVATHRASVTDGNGRYFCCRTCCSRASESQREGGFAGWVEVDRNTTHRKYEGRNSHGAACFAIGDIEDDSPHTSTVEPCQAYPNEIELGERGYRSRFAGGDWTNHSYVPYGDCGCVPGTAHGCEPPQPAPMTRAARVLAGLERDPYLQSRIDCSGVPRSGKRAALESGNPKDGQTRLLTDSHPRNEAARLRMAKWSLDRPLDAEQARWERLVCSKVPVGRR